MPKALPNFWLQVLVEEAIKYVHPEKGVPFRQLLMTLGILTLGNNADYLTLEDQRGDEGQVQAQLSKTAGKKILVLLRKSRARKVRTRERRSAMSASLKPGVSLVGVTGAVNAFAPRPGTALGEAHSEPSLEAALSVRASASATGRRPSVIPEDVELEEDGSQSPKGQDPRHLEGSTQDVTPSSSLSQLRMAAIAECSFFCFSEHADGERRGATTRSR